MRHSFVAAAGLLLAAGRLLAAGLTVDARLPAYEPAAPVSGEIVCAGNHATEQEAHTLQHLAKDDIADAEQESVYQNAAEKPVRELYGKASARG